ncbi:MAG TPA: hypothetical protein VFG54_17360 [Prolixibacteraceae bacterium]|nr:hypothetical protein [Prolixibacteraceae bacterium]
METKDLQNSIIQKVLHTEDNQLLNYLYKLLNNNENQQFYQLSEFERSLISESQADYEEGNVISKEDIISRNEEWLKA